MRQQTTNTFDKGLNKDLNPIVTPSDVLTDCLNGTFITFNGDELTLQNDAGNTTIPIPGTEDVVKLSEGFHPLGMKEYGGVLYIASGKYGNIGTEVNGTIIKEGDAGATKDMIEFGSYPAPMFAAPRENESFYALKNLEEGHLYKSVIINDHDFKSGGYLAFTPGEGAMPVIELPENLWTPTNTTGFYKVRLMHQFDTGVFELTDLIWEKYLIFKSEYEDEPAHWINSNAFRYFCPNRYKGKLAIIVEINEPEEFGFKIAPKISFVDPVFHLNMYLEMDDRVSVEGQEPLVEFRGYRVDLTFNDNTTAFKEILNSEPDNTIFIPSNKKHLSYQVTPITNYEWDILPTEFKEKFTLRGNLFLEDRYLALYFKREKGICLEGDDRGYKRYELVTLWSGDNYWGVIKEGESNRLVEVAPDGLYEGEKVKPAAFFFSGAENTDLWEEDYYKLGEFTVDSKNKLELVKDASYTNFKDSLIPFDQETLNFYESAPYIVKEKDSGCDARYMTINFQTNPSKVTMFWKNYPGVPATIIKDDALSYRVLIIDKGDVLSVSAFGKLTRFIENSRTDNIFTFWTPIVKILRSHHACTISSIGIGDWENDRFVFPNGTSTSFPSVSVTMNVKLSVSAGHIKPIYDNDLRFFFPMWNVLSYSIDKDTNSMYTINFRLGVSQSPPSGGGGGGGGGDPIKPVPPINQYSIDPPMSMFMIPDQQVPETSQMMVDGKVYFTATGKAGDIENSETITLPISGALKVKDRE